MRHHRIHPIAAFLLALIFGPYVLAVGAILAVIWLVTALIVLPFGPRR